MRFESVRLVGAVGIEIASQISKPHRTKALLAAPKRNCCQMLPRQNVGWSVAPPLVWSRGVVRWFRQDWCGVWISLWFCVWTRRHRLDAARQTSRHHEHQLCLPAFLVPLGGGHPERLFAKSEPAQNRWDAPIARNLRSELDCAGRSSLTAKIHFFSTDVTRCLALCKVRLLPRDFPSITVRWACK